jgi:protein-tyrosine phosphatase
MLSSVYSILYTIVQVTADKSYYLIYGDSTKEDSSEDTTEDSTKDSKENSSYVIVKRMRNKPLTESIYDHISAPFINITQIDDYIYLGNAYNAADYYYLKNFGITGIVNASNEISNYFEDNFDYFKIDIFDINNSSIYKFFDPYIEFVKKTIENKGKIMVHCFMGSSRSAILVVLYLVYFKSYTVEHGIEYITNKRNRVNINITYLDELKKYLLNNNINNK